MDKLARHDAIVALLARAGRVSVTQLASELNVTTETIRRDLAMLEREGRIDRVHGGALLPRAATVPETDLRQRQQQAAAEKAAIAAATVTALQLPPGTSLILDAGSTTQAVARCLPPDLTLTIITNSPIVAHELAATAARRANPTAHPWDIIMLGGRIRGVTQAAVGASTVLAATALRVDLAVLGTNGYTPARGFTTPDPDEAAVKQAFAAAARRTVVVTDSSKFGQEHLVSFLSPTTTDLLVTDQAPSENPHGMEIVTP
ncbi:DeoR/GlpR transcriptional regulator [Buchananella hordeovulneris]|uniref:DeoR/GlpR family DNA-binding transcription regulator n=1 Tax=Buchananella hordeovulneris TaxID=52770 RepID=UPI000F5E886A|nr:DeoR/GlpR family DNA-binding transcription regulator [Buchananella hordeovulneris]RRD53502.1 DeoR/GlpR transcriptional regulator [Buchananella hordeovulneris]